ncbi:MAG: MBL fold metallo-hydrolase [Chloroflexota bacterium]
MPSSQPATLDWFGCATFRMQVDGLTLFLDAYIDRVEGSDGPPGASADQITACDYILIGHSHFDHIWGAERIAKQTGAKIIGTYESIRMMAAEGVPEAQLLPVSGGETIELSETVTVHTFPMLHSCLGEPYNDGEPDTACIDAYNFSYFEKQAVLSKMQADIVALGDAIRQHVENGDQGCRGEGGVLGFLIETPEGSLFFKDTPGHWSALLTQIKADVAILAASGRPNIDGQPIQGSLVDFISAEVDALNCRRVIPCHHDNYLPGFADQSNMPALKAGVLARCPDVDFVIPDYEPGYKLFE